MTITTYINNSENNRLTKILTQIKQYSGCSAITPMSIINPVIDIIDTNFNVNCNYIYITDLNRYYFVNNITALNNGRWQLDCHIDVLMSYADNIKQQQATFRRQESLYNMYITDPEFHVESKTNTVTRYLNGAGFELSSNSIILTVANGGV